MTDAVAVKVSSKSANDANTEQLTGGRVDYYLVQVKHPQRPAQAPYQAECEDIIQALGMDFNEGCVFKALWRSAAARNGVRKLGHSPLYDAEKIVHYAERIIRALRQGEG